MSDILEKLYAVPETGADPELIEDAAAEIERLRAELDAAPELLEALQMLLEFPNTGPATSAARAAIAKATGKIK